MSDDLVITDTGEVHIWIEGERPMGWNKLNTRAHWTRRKMETQRCHDLVYVFSRGVPHFPGVVDIELVAYLEPPIMDSDNVNAKFYIDGLHPDVIPDDDPAHVRRVTTCSKKVSNGGAGIMIKIIPVE